MRRLRSTLVLIATGILLAAVTPAAAQHEHHDKEKKCNPTAAEKEEAADFARRTKNAVRRYEDIAKAREDSFFPWVDTYKPIFHMVKYEHYYDWKVLDPNRPEALVYAHQHGAPKLIGVMYSMEDPGREPPPMGGCITRWHTHPQCRSPFGYSHIWEENWGDCPPGWEDDGGSEQMLHVWTVRTKGGPYAYEPDPRWSCWPRPLLIL